MTNNTSLCPLCVGVCKCLSSFSIQLAVDATIPVSFGGCGSEAIYIDTEGSFVTERVVQIANATIRHIQAVADSTGDQGKRMR